MAPAPAKTVATATSGFLDGYLRNGFSWKHKKYDRNNAASFSSMDIRTSIEQAFFTHSILKKLMEIVARKLVLL